MGLWPGLIISGYYGAPARRRPIGGILDGMEMGGGRSLAPLHDGPDHHRGDRTEFERTVASNSTDRLALLWPNPDQLSSRPKPGSRPEKDGCRLQLLGSGQAGGEARALGGLIRCMPALLHVCCPPRHILGHRTRATLTSLGGSGQSPCRFRARQGGRAMRHYAWAARWPLWLEEQWLKVCVSSPPRCENLHRVGPTGRLRAATLPDLGRHRTRFGLR